MDRLTRDAALRWVADGTRGVVVAVADARGSAPREAGARMLVGAGEAIGTIGGGHLEWKAIAEARDMLRTGEAGRRTRHYSLGPGLGQCCGGAVTIAYTPLDAAALATWPKPEPLFHLQMFGAGHVGCAIATLLATLDCRVEWFDERDDAFPATTALGSPWPAHIRRVSIDAIEAEARHAPPGAHYLVLTHDHDLDLRITEAVLRRDDFAYLGLIGSKTKRARFARRFEQRGLAPAVIARMTCPIGDDRIAGKEPAVIAAGVLGQLLRVAARR